MQLPGDRFPCVERVPVVVGKRPYVRFDRNDYSVPHVLVQRDLELLADLETVRVCDGIEVVATHERCWDAGKPIEDPRHIRELVDEKRRARSHRGMDRLRHAAPTTAVFLQRAAERGRNLGNATAKLLELLDEYGAALLEPAISEVLARDVIHVACGATAARTATARPRATAADRGRAQRPAPARRRHASARPRNVRPHQQGRRRWPRSMTPTI